MRSSVGALTGVGGQEAAPSDQGGAGQSLVLRWACVILVHGCTCMGLWLGMERLYFGVVGQPAAGECDAHFEAGSRRLVHEFIGWAPVWGRNAVLVAGVLWVCRRRSDCRLDSACVGIFGYPASQVVPCSLL